MSYNTLRVSIPAPMVLLVELNRPNKLNAMNAEFWKEIREIFESAVPDDVRVIVVHGGDAKGFSAGLDLAATTFPHGADPARQALHLLPHIELLQDSFTAIEKCRVPVIAAIDGVCFGGAIDLITACDIRIAAVDALFSVKEVDVGLAADVGTLQRLPKVVGNISWVREVCLTARNFGADEALQHGLISKILPSRDAVRAEALRLANEIAEKSPVAVTTTKRVLNYSRDHSVADGLHYVAVANSAMLQTTDVKEAIKGWMMKKKPLFSKL